MTWPNGSALTGSNQWGPYGPDNSDGQLPLGNIAENVAETVPSPPTFNAANGISSTQEYLEKVIAVDSAQQGAPALNAAPVLAGTTGIMVNNWYAGTVGTVGNKFT